MRTTIYCISFLLAATSILIGCKRSDFLDEKPATSLLVPKTLKDFQQLLDNIPNTSSTGIALPLLSSDEYSLSFADWQALTSATQRNAYTWSSDIYQGENGVYNWDRSYSQIFYANNVLEGLEKTDNLTSSEGLYLKGYALFIRAFAFYDLTRNYCKAYDGSSASTDLGIPLRVKAQIDYIEPRGSIQQSFDQIIGDLLTAENLLPSTRSSENLNRPTRIAVYALLARVYLDMRKYQDAENYANKCLSLYSNLMDYNSISPTSTFPFTTINNVELIYISSTGPVYSEITGASSASKSRINSDLINLYPVNDLRLTSYFSKLANGTYYKKRGYAGNITLAYPFMGLATDEIYLIKSECLARRNETQASMDKLNELLIKRLSNATIYIPLTANSGSEALTLILKERRKELVWRGLRWFDLKRLNKEGANISLSRTLNGITYTLPPNDPRWVFPIYPLEISLSGIQQNDR